jgi:hypothetical protein
MSIPKKHHYLPQYYLEGFKIVEQSFKVPHIWMTQKTANFEPVCPSIIDAGCESGYHDDDRDPDNKDKVTVERALSKIEGSQAKTISDVISNKTVSTEHRKSLALFISIMRCRVPSFKKQIENYLQSTVSSTIQLGVRSGRIQAPPPQLADYIKEKDNIIISNWMLLYHMINAGIRSDAPAILERMHYSLIESQEDVPFIIGDSPVSHYVPDYEVRRPYGVGLVDKEIEISIPLTARHLLLLSWQPMPQHQGANNRQVQEWNRRTIISADRFIYASKVYEGFTEKVSSLHDTFSGFENHSLDCGDGFWHINRFIPVSGSKQQQ